MSIIVWSIRSVMETVFNWVLLAHRALSHEMEFDADSVSVSVTGSDALINGLFRIQTADTDWNVGLDFINTQLNKGKQVNDLFLVQDGIRDHFREILNEPDRGNLPEEDSTDPASNRIFTEDMAQPPRMWSTHPPNNEREENAKQTYVSMEIDDEPAWTLFRNPELLRKSVTGLLFEGYESDKPLEEMSSKEVESSLDDEYTHESYKKKYRGVYLGRYLTLGIDNPSEVYNKTLSHIDLDESLNELYPDSLQLAVKKWRKLEDEIATLESIQFSSQSTTEGEIYHRGQEIKRSSIPGLVEEVKKESDLELEKIENHDLKCRLTCLKAAKHLIKGWPEYLQSLFELLHYAEHCLAELDDASRYLGNVTVMLTAGGHVSSGKRDKIVKSANDLQKIMSSLEKQSKDVRLPPAILKELEIESWKDSIDKMELPPADEVNIGEWLQVVEGWIHSQYQPFSKLRKATLAELLKTEQFVIDQYINKEVNQVEEAPPVAKLPEEYIRRMRGTERERITTLDWWSRFKLADGSGFNILRFAIAFSIVAGIVVGGLVVGSVKLSIYNGLVIPVEVTVNNKKITVPSGKYRSMSIGTKLKTEVVAKTKNGDVIEQFQEEMDKAFADYVYNVANAATIVEWTAVYGTRSEVPPRHLGAPQLVHLKSISYLYRTTKRNFHIRQRGVESCSEC